MKYTFENIWNAKNPLINTDNIMNNTKLNEIKFRKDVLRKDLITKRMIELNINMQDSADQIGISKATYSRMESGKDMDMESFVKVLNWLNKRAMDYINSGIRTRSGE